MARWGDEYEERAIKGDAGGTIFTVGIGFVNKSNRMKGTSRKWLQDDHVTSFDG